MGMTSAQEVMRVIAKLIAIGVATRGASGSLGAHYRSRDLPLWFLGALQK
jgi:hypothetical protein